MAKSNNSRAFYFSHLVKTEEDWTHCRTLYGWLVAQDKVNEAFSQLKAEVRAHEPARNAWQAYAAAYQDFDAETAKLNKTIPNTKDDRPLTQEEIVDLWTRAARAAKALDATDGAERAPTSKLVMGGYAYLSRDGFKALIEQHGIDTAYEVLRYNTEKKDWGIRLSAANFRQSSALSVVFKWLKSAGHITFGRMWYEVKKLSGEENREQRIRRKEIAHMKQRDELNPLGLDDRYLSTLARRAGVEYVPQPRKKKTPAASEPPPFSLDLS